MKRPARVAPRFDVRPLLVWAVLLAGGWAITALVAGSVLAVLLLGMLAVTVVTVTVVARTVSRTVEADRDLNTVLALRWEETLQLREQEATGHVITNRPHPTRTRPTTPRRTAADRRGAA